MIRKGYRKSCGLLFLLLVESVVFGQAPDRRVVDNTLISAALPRIEVEIDKSFKYIGRFPFRIRNVAAGERHLFVERANGKVERMFIEQFEGFLPHIDNFYRYKFENAMELGAFKFRQNNYAYSNKQARKENPFSEGVLTEDFLKIRGFELEDELMMSRFVAVVSEDKKHEFILYYAENVSESDHTLDEFYENDKPTAIWIQISIGLTERSLKSFKVL